MLHGFRPVHSRLVTSAVAATLAFSVAGIAPSYAAIPGPVSAAAPLSVRASSPAALPASLPFADSAFETVWTRNDQLVASKAVTRSWMWGPAPLASGLETYSDAPDGSGKRLVQYFDKSRMEINNPKDTPDDKWFVTNGLLTVELVSGQIQTGNSKFETRQPADIPLASDTDDANAPTYASFGTVSNTSAGEKRQADKSNGGHATGRINKAGAVTDDPSKANLAETKIAYFEKATGHNVPQVFWNFLNSGGSVRSGVGTANRPLLDPWVFAMGYPISDAYWATVKIEGKMQDVLIQAFERRVLTYAPGLPAGWQVQMGNIGQHYYQWRYGNSGGPQKLPASAPGIPAHLSIPALGVLTNVEQVGVDKQNNMDIPKDPANVAWFKLGTLPGLAGNSVIDGHLDWYGIQEAVFYFLGSLKPGDRVYVRDANGRDRAFVVTTLMSCDYNKCPLNDIFGPNSTPRLNLITCDGTFNKSSQNYSKRLVVFSQLASQ